METHPIPQALPLSKSDVNLGINEIPNSENISDITFLVEKELLNTYAPPSAIITELGEILFIHGRLGNYLEPSPGKAKLNISDMAREGLNFELDSAIQIASSKKKEVFLEDLRVKTNGSYSNINLSVKPLTLENLKGLLMVSFEEVDIKENNKDEKIKIDITAYGEKQIKELRSELKLIKERLKVTVEAMENSNEELRSANEELQSMNEEAQSTNEELETSKEELQSINEEMVTVNNELQMRIDELIQTKDDMNNLFNSTEIAVIFLDKDLKIRRFTKESTKLIKMIDSDVGRPLSDIASNLDYTNLEKDIDEVIKRVAYKEEAVQTFKGEWYHLRIMPYKTSDNLIDGAVITFNNINEQHKIQQKTLEALDYAESIINTIREPLMVLNADFKVISCNKSFYNLFKLNESEVEGKYFFKLDKGDWNITELKNLLENVLPIDQEIKDFKVEKKFHDLGYKKLILNSKQIQSNGEAKMILLAIEDIKNKIS